jgi:hypothetical protein
VKPGSRRLEHLSAVIIILACLSILAALVARNARWERWLKANGCRVRPMQDPATTVGRAAGERCYDCEGRVTVCR